MELDKNYYYYLFPKHNALVLVAGSPGDTVACVLAGKEGKISVVHAC